MAKSKISPFHPASLAATTCGIGYLPIAPGTWASAAALVPAWFIADQFGPLALIPAALAALALGLWATAHIQRTTGEKDPGRIVIDEVAGQWIALIPVWPLDPWLYATGFFAFRLFDILKPWPANWCDQSLPGAPGVMLDDIVAGIYAAIIVFGLTFVI